jgi:hypothetical protein
VELIGRIVPADREHSDPVDRSLAGFVGINPMAESFRGATPVFSSGALVRVFAGCAELVRAPNLSLGWSSHQIHSVVDRADVPLIPHFARAAREWKVAHQDVPDEQRFALHHITPTHSGANRAIELHFRQTRYSTVLSIKPLIDEDLLWEDGSVVSPREKFHTSLFRLAESPIPNAFVLHEVLVTTDGFVVLAQRSRHVAYWPEKWVVGLEEQLAEEDWTHDAPLHSCGLRGIREELGVGEGITESSVVVLSIFLETENLNTGAVGVIRLPTSLTETQARWRGQARDRNEVAPRGPLGLALQDEDTLADIVLGRSVSIADSTVGLHDWHPTARYRLLTFLLHSWGENKATRVLSERVKAHS